MDLSRGDALAAALRGMREADETMAKSREIARIRVDRLRNTVPTLEKWIIAQDTIEDLIATNLALASGMKKLGQLSADMLTRLDRLERL